VLVLLINAFEQQNIPIPPPDPVDAIRFRMEQSNLTAADLASLLGVSRRRVLAILRGGPLTLPMIRLLVERLGISAEVLIHQPASTSA
jgi:HTH-type transcriptional regulator/antitoxin HigA